MTARLRSFGTRRIAVVVLALGLAGVVAVPTILAATPAASGGSTAAGLDLTAPGMRAGRILRGDVIVLKRDGTTMTAHFERGEITAAAAGAVTIKGADGTSSTFTIGPDTRIRTQGKAVDAGSLKVGDRAMAVGTRSGSGYAALLVRVPKPAN